jgi:hypothetical protein
MVGIGFDSLSINLRFSRTIHTGTRSVLPSRSSKQRKAEMLCAFTKFFCASRQENCHSSISEFVRQSGSYGNTLSLSFVFYRRPFENGLGSSNMRKLGPGSVAYDLRLVVPIGVMA